MAATTALAFPHGASAGKPGLQGLVLSRRLLVALAHAGDRAELEAAGAQHGETGTMHVVLDRGADVQLIDLVSRRNRETLHSDSDGKSKHLRRISAILPTFSAIGTIPGGRFSTPLLGSKLRAWARCRGERNGNPRSDWVPTTPRTTAPARTTRSRTRSREGHPSEEGARSAQALKVIRLSSEQGAAFRGVYE
jgi:hypothetical protein